MLSELIKKLFDVQFSNSARDGGFTEMDFMKRINNIRVKYDQFWEKTWVKPVLPVQVVIEDSKI